MLRYWSERTLEIIENRLKHVGNTENQIEDISHFLKINIEFASGRLIRINVRSLWPLPFCGLLLQMDLQTAPPRAKPDTFQVH